MNIKDSIKEGIIMYLYSQLFIDSLYRCRPSLKVTLVGPLALLGIAV